MNGSEIVRAANVGRNAGAVRLAVGERAAAGFHQQRIDVAVIAAFELDDLVAAGESARQPEAGHRRFGPAVDHPHFLDRRHPAADQLRHFHFERIGDSEADAARRRGADRVDHDLRRVPEDRRAPGADVIDVFIAIDVPDPCALRALDEERLAAETAKGAHRRIDAAGDALQAAAKRSEEREGIWRSGKRPMSNAKRPTLKLRHRHLALLLKIGGD